ncbi:MAG: hypothetical protein HC892_03135 [Saprospiraceae bacterium]|nr:hypothetical protein [Saprospiraceae bacterium]
MLHRSLNWGFIIFLTLGLINCKENTPQMPSTSDKDLTDLDTTKALALIPTVATVWVDQLRMRTFPTLESSVVVELQSGDTLYYLHEKTVQYQTLVLRDSTFYSPWLKMKTRLGQTGWVYGGGVVFDFL